ncbi:MAG: hypothetical protein KAV82_06525 [Phycisphaerae bacterium]|nr:hypothetical protein [Phycisphaerae bacterium]
MIRVRLIVLRLRRYASDTWFEAYGDLGAGTIDYAHPFPPGGVRFWVEAGERNGHLYDGHLALRHLDSVDPDGHLETVHLEAEHLWPAWLMVVDSPAYVFGRFDHAVKVFDGAGNTSSGSPAQYAVTVNAAPPAPRRFKCTGYDSGADQITFSFHGSRFEPIRGI